VLRPARTAKGPRPVSSSRPPKRHRLSASADGGEGTKIDFYTEALLPRWYGRPSLARDGLSFIMLYESDVLPENMPLRYGFPRNLGDDKQFKRRTASSPDDSPPQPPARPRSLDRDQVRLRSHRGLRARRRRMVREYSQTEA